jgi:hypothetical protein
MWRKGAPWERVLAVTAASARTWSCRPPGSTMSLKSRFTASALFSMLPPPPPAARFHQWRRDVSRTSFGVPSHLPMTKDDR